MKLNVTVELDDLYMDEETPLEEILTSEIKNAVVKEVSKKFAGKGIEEVGATLSTQVSSQIETFMRDRAESFMSEEIALTDKWGKPTFIGSIEDLMRLKFDETVLFHVNSNGEKLNGCRTSEGETWVQWQIRTGVNELLKREVSNAKDIIARDLKRQLQDTLESYKDGLLKHEVTAAVGKILGANSTN